MKTGFTPVPQVLTTLRKNPLKNVGKGENAGYQHFLLFPTLLSTHSKTNFTFKVTCILSSANVLILDQSKNLLFDKGLMYLQKV